MPIGNPNHGLTMISPTHHLYGYKHRGNMGTSDQSRVAPLVVQEQLDEQIVDGQCDDLTKRQHATGIAGHPLDHHERKT